MKIIFLTFVLKYRFHNFSRFFIEHFRNETGTFCGEKGEKCCVRVSSKRGCIQICHYIVAEEPQYCGTWQLIKKKKKEIEMKRGKKKKTMASPAL